jgi:hypothetical protein
MPQKATPVSSVPKSPPKSRRSARKRAQSSTDNTTQPPAKKVAMGDGEEEKESGEEGKGIKYANQFHIFKIFTNLILLIENLDRRRKCVLPRQIPKERGVYSIHYYSTFYLIVFPCISRKNVNTSDVHLTP